jgi:tetratricopeptide (TPR) repeat protein
MDIASVQTAIAEAWQSARSALEVWKQELDPVIWIVSALLALIPGSFAIYKWWTYRNSRLPQRLKEILENEERRLLETRSALVQLVAKPDASVAPVPTPLFSEPQLKTLIRKLNWARWWRPRPLATVAAEVELALDEIEQQIKFCEKRTTVFRSQEVTAYLLKGAIAAADASRRTTGSKEYEDLNRSALNHFRRALDMEPFNPEILEYVAHQHRVLDDTALALEGYQKLASLPGHEQLRSRAMRYAAEMLEKQYDQSRVSARLTEARDYLEKALAALPVDERNRLLHAEVLEVLGRVRLKLGNVSVPFEHFRSALSIYRQITQREPGNVDASAGEVRMIAALTSSQASQVTAVLPQPSGQKAN